MRDVTALLADPRVARRLMAVASAPCQAGRCKRCGASRAIGRRDFCDPCAGVARSDRDRRYRATRGRAAA